MFVIVIHRPRYIPLGFSCHYRPVATNMLYYPSLGHCVQWQKVGKRTIVEFSAFGS